MDETDHLFMIDWVGRSFVLEVCGGTGHLITHKEWVGTDHLIIRRYGSFDHEGWVETDHLIIRGG